MKLGFDLDNILVNTPPIIPNSVIEWLYRGKSNGLLKYRYPSKTEQFIRVLSHAPILRPVIKKNLKFLNKLSSEGEHEMFLISSRFGFLQSRTSKIVKKYHLDKFFRELYFNYENKQPHFFKHEVIRKLKLDKFVDDDLYLLEYIASKNNSVKLYWLNSKLNKTISKNVHAITDLENILS